MNERALFGAMFAAGIVTAVVAGLAGWHLGRSRTAPAAAISSTAVPPPASETVIAEPVSPPSEAPPVPPAAPAPAADAPAAGAPAAALLPAPPEAASPDLAPSLAASRPARAARPLPMPVPEALPAPPRAARPSTPPDQPPSVDSVAGPVIAEMPRMAARDRSGSLPSSPASTVPPASLPPDAPAVRPDFPSQGRTDRPAQGRPLTSPSAEPAKPALTMDAAPEPVEVAASPAVSTALVAESLARAQPAETPLDAALKARPDSAAAASVASRAVELLVTEAVRLAAPMPAEADHPPAQVLAGLPVPVLPADPVPAVVPSRQAPAAVPFVAPTAPVSLGAVIIGEVAASSPQVLVGTEATAALPESAIVPLPTGSSWAKPRKDARRAEKRRRAAVMDPRQAGQTHRSRGLRRHFARNRIGPGEDIRPRSPLTVIDGTAPRHEFGPVLIRIHSARNGRIRTSRIPLD